MKRTLLLLTMGALLTVPALAQTSVSGTTTSNFPPPHPHDGPGGHMGGLTPKVRQELMAARQEAMQANPELAAEQKALQEKINAAMIKADPNVAPIIAKLEAARQHHEGQGGPGGSGGSGGPSGN
jgi:hypothetical protein